MNSLFVALVITSIVLIIDLFQESIPPSYTLRITMKSSVESVAKVYYDIGNNLNEDHSKSHKVLRKNDFQQLEFNLPVRSIRRLRFDPLRNEGKFEIKGAYIVNKNNETVNNIDLRSITSLNQIKSLYLNKDGNTLIGITTQNANDPMLDLNVSFPLPLLFRLNYGYQFDLKRIFRLYFVVFPLSFIAITFAYCELDN